LSSPKEVRFRKPVLLSQKKRKALGSAEVAFAGATRDRQ
jgi:hypothetical protein